MDIKLYDLMLKINLNSHNYESDCRRIPQRYLDIGKRFFFKVNQLCLWCPNL
jgi:hypothetical protein